MNNVVGQPVEDEDFFDREDELERLWERVVLAGFELLCADAGGVV